MNEPPTSWPLREEDKRSGLLVKLRRDADAGDAELRLVDRCCDLYEAAGIIKGDIGRPLHEACPLARDCWDAFSDGAKPTLEQASVSVPWIGSGYVNNRLCAVAINQNEYGD